MAYSYGAKPGGKSLLNGGWQRNYNCQQRQVGRANEGSISEDVYGFDP